MKSTAVCAALLDAAFVTSATAAQVDLYGVLDTAMTWSKRNVVGGNDTDTFQMKSGQWFGTRFGIKGTEELANGLKVGFVVESGFADDTGALSQEGRLFGRDARVFLDGDFGFLSFGRMGSMVGGNGPYARFGHVVSPFSCGWGDIGGHLQVVSLGYEFIDNAVAYTTPKFAGIDATFQYSFGTNVNAYGDNGVEGKSSVDRLASGAIRYQNENMMLAFGIETIDQAQPAADKNGLDDSLSYNFGANYDAGWMKFFFYSQIFENYLTAAKTTMMLVPSGIDGYGVNVGVNIPMLGGIAKVSVGYGDFEGSKKSEYTMKTWQTAVGFNYDISKRTIFYTGANWITVDYSKEYEAYRPQSIDNIYEITMGLVHRF